MIGLALSGGSIKGAFQAGVILALEEKGKLKDLSLAAGTSVGALNAMALSYMSPQELVDIYMSLKKKSDVFKAAWWRASGLYSTKPVNNLMMEAIKGKTKKFESVAVCINLETGERLYASSKEPGYALFVKASAVIPMFMEPLKELPQYFDGGVFEHTPARYVMDRMDSMRNKGKPQTIVITTRPINKLQPYRLRFPRIWHSLFATMDKRMQDEIFRNDLRHCNEWDIPVICPKDFIDVGTFEINPDKIKRMIDDGYEQGVRYAG